MLADGNQLCLIEADDWVKEGRLEAAPSTLFSFRKGHKLVFGPVPSPPLSLSHAAIMHAANIILAAHISLLPNLSGKEDLVSGFSIDEVLFLFLEMVYNSSDSFFFFWCLGEMSPFLSRSSRLISFCCQPPSLCWSSRSWLSAQNYKVISQTYHIMLLSWNKHFLQSRSLLGSERERSRTRPEDIIMTIIIIIILISPTVWTAVLPQVSQVQNLCENFHARHKLQNFNNVSVVMHVFNKVAL